MKNNEPQTDINFLKVNYFFEKDIGKLKKRIENASRVTRTYKSRKLSVRIMRFIKKLVLGLPKKSMVFNAAKGKLCNKRHNHLKISIKDPFIKELNYGREMLDETNLSHLVTTLTHFMKAAANKNVD